MEFVGLDKLSILDYEDMVSAVIFTPKCNFRCPFCHNGTTVLTSTDVIPFNDILDCLKSRIGLLDAVVVTGGEPTLMPELKDRISQIKSLGFKVKLDTNGTRPDVIKDLVDNNLIDYVAMDIKNSLKMYPETAGYTFPHEEKIKESVEYLKQNHIKYEFRTTLVNEYHTVESIKEMGELVKGADILYLQKFVDREGVIKQGLHEVKEDLAIEFQKVLLEYVKEVKLRGY